MKDLNKYIEINHHLMTVKELAEEAAVSEWKIRQIMDANGWKPMIEGDRNKEYMRSHTHLYVEDFMVKFNINRPSVLRLARELGLHIKDRPKEKPKEQLRVKLSFTSNLFPNKYDPINYKKWGWVDFENNFD